MKDSTDNFNQEMQDKLQEAIELYKLDGVHPAATIPPFMTRDEYDDLLEDVKAKGFLHPVRITKDKLLIDGRNRLCVSIDIGLDASLEEYNPVDPISYVLSENKRRNLNPGQKAAMATTAEEMYAVEALKKKSDGGKKAGREGGKEKDEATLPQPKDKGKARAEQSRDKAAKATGASARSVQDAKALKKADPELFKKVLSGEIALGTAMKTLKDRKRTEGKSKDTSGTTKAVSKEDSSKFNRTDENIGWAWWSWNPQTGCLHGCEGCYARDIANRFYKDEKFEPTFHPERLNAPKNTKVPKSDEPASRNVFLVSMGDLWGKWVPDDHIQQVLDVCRESPEWNFLCLTKYPERYLKFDLPENCWIGITGNTQKRMDKAVKIFRKLREKGVKNVLFVSCEPLEENVRIPENSFINLVIIGARSRTTELPASQPEWKWIEDLLYDARSEGAYMYFKDNLVLEGPKELPNWRK